MSGEEKYNIFISSIDNWICNSGIIDIKLNPSVERCLNLSQSDIRALSGHECLEYSYELYAYAEYLDSIFAKQQIALDWAEDSIWYIISDKIDQYGDKYTKWQEKYFHAVKENPLATQIMKVKNTASARIKVLENKIATIKKMSEILLSLSKRK